jgi:hypothetical protein
MLRRHFATAALLALVIALAVHSTPRGSSAGPPVFEHLWGDQNCNGEIQSPDALLSLYYVLFAGHLGYIPEGVCWPEVMGIFADTMLQVEGGPQVQWSDLDCSGEISPVDALLVLRYVAGMEALAFPGCPEVGALVRLSFAN